MNAWASAGLALLALLGGGALLGWQGVIFAMVGVVVWLVLQMRQLMRVMKAAGNAAPGALADAAALHGQLRTGMKLVDLIALTGSLGVKQAADTYVWRDPRGDAVEVVLRKGRLAEWRLVRSLEATGSP